MEASAQSGGAEADPGVELLRRWQADGDRDALDRLLQLEVRLLKDRLRRRGHGMFDGSASVSDIAQEAVMRLLEVSTDPHFETPAALRAYLWTAAWRLLIDHVRRPSHRMQALDPSNSGRLADGLVTSGGLTAIDSRERSVALDVAINLLKDADREVLQLVYFEQLDMAEAATRLGLSRDATKMRAMRARRALAEKLDAWSDLVG